MNKRTGTPIKPLFLSCSSVLPFWPILYRSPSLVPLLAYAVRRQGELYFELHRGTYTSHAANKAFNRRCELLLRDVEMAASIALTVGGRPMYTPRSWMHIY